jgi:hypothetical protein
VLLLIITFDSLIKRCLPQRLAAAEKKLEKKEKRAEKLEKIFLAEEEQEKKTLGKKLEAARNVS